LQRASPAAAPATEFVAGRSVARPGGTGNGRGRDRRDGGTFARLVARITRRRPAIEVSGARLEVHYGPKGP